MRHASTTWKKRLVARSLLRQYSLSSAVETVEVLGELSLSTITVMTTVKAEIKSSDDFLKTSIWKGNTNQSLERFMDQHWLAYIALQKCAEHVIYQLPHDRTRVKYLID